MFSHFESARPNFNDSFKKTKWFFCHTFLICLPAEAVQETVQEQPSVCQDAAVQAGEDQKMFCTVEVHHGPSVELMLRRVERKFPRCLVDL